VTSPVVLVTGGTGQVGWELVRTLSLVGRVVAPLRAELDLSDVDAARTYVRALAPSIIVNAAAYTAVDRAEDDVDVADRINARAPEMLAEEAARSGATMIHFSTDYVFDGAAAAPYVEDSITAPRSAYGATKLAGEQAVAAVGGRAIIIRTGWVYAARGRNFLETMMRRAAGPDPLRVVADQWGTPTPARLLAQATATMLQHERVRSAAPGNDVWGVYHIAPSGQTTWHGFAAAILARLATAGRAVARIEAITTAEYPTRASRPAYSVLDTTKARRTFGLHLPPWDEQLALVLDERLAGHPV
jgi:dTDP-4-dehydrorhamnose reductase